MEKLFYPESIAIVGLSSSANNIPRIVLENLIRWGYRGRIFGINPRVGDVHVDGIKMYKDVQDLPVVPDLVFIMIPARLIPEVIDACGRAGVKRMAIPSGGFNESGEEGKKLSALVLQKARQYGIRFVGPNGVTVANTANGLCLPFVPSFSPPKGGLSIISQSGGVGLMLWNLMTDENVGMAKFASIGNKLDLDEVDFLEYFGRDPETKVIGMYLESIPRGDRLIEAASRINKPIIILKSNTTSAGQKAAMSHTAALANNEDIINIAFERAGIIRINHFNDFISMAKVFELPAMRGNRMMIMSPAGGFTVMMADLCEESGFEFADPGASFYDTLKESSNAGVINFSNPLDMGDIYDTKASKSRPTPASSISPTPSTWVIYTTPRRTPTFFSPSCTTTMLTARCSLHSGLKCRGAKIFSIRCSTRIFPRKWPERFYHRESPWEYAFSVFPRQYRRSNRTWITRSSTMPPK